MSNNSNNSDAGQPGVKFETMLEQLNHQIEEEQMKIEKEIMSLSYFKFFMDRMDEHRNFMTSLSEKLKSVRMVEKQREEPEDLRKKVQEIENTVQEIEHTVKQIQKSQENFQTFVQGTLDMMSSKLYEKEEDKEETK
ncbi:uncharacterized protein LOC106754290 [Vigna radiata var. radiata]|uniref:Uncharacterized protein LOC106754290 n=1 Tax=Vigna radiata var. radiata TaxID=3916 RepID=A0A1S3TDE2_VIGRR|nr:uncharacterized protein LOC106754290 [Vigna radiata var. radiata]